MVKTDPVDQDEVNMNVTNDDMTELYFKRYGAFPFEKYVNRLKECYKNLEEIGHMEFEAQKVQTLLNHINYPDKQVKECVHTVRK